MPQRWRATVAAGVVAIAGAAGTALAQAPAPTPGPADPVEQGYTLLYQGDLPAATRYFETRLKESADDLALRFGWLMVEEARIRHDIGRVARYERELDALITLAGARYDRTHTDVGALFYLANAHFMRAAYRFDHDKGMWGAARDGASAKNYIDAYLKQYPNDGDAYLVLGAYNYYVDIIPTFFKVMRFLMFLPSGNRVEGLTELERASRDGRLFTPFAKTLLMEAYSDFEGRSRDAIAIGEELVRAYPASDAANIALAEVYASPAVEDHARAVAEYQAIANRHADDRSIEGTGARAQALLGVAAQRQEDWRFDDAIAALTPTIDLHPRQPEYVYPQFLLRRANYRALLDDPAAVEDAQRVLKDVPGQNWQKEATDLVTWIQGRRASGEAARYAALVPVNRLVAEGQWDEARRRYEEIRAREPQNTVVQYRIAYLDFVSGHVDRALPAFTALAGNRTVPENLRAMSLLYVGRAHDLAGERAEALRFYQKVIDQYEHQRAADFARVGLLTPYARMKI